MDSSFEGGTDANAQGTSVSANANVLMLTFSFETWRTSSVQFDDWLNFDPDLFLIIYITAW